MIFTPGKKVLTTFQAFQILNNYIVKIKQKTKKQNNKSREEDKEARKQIKKRMVKVTVH